VRYVSVRSGASLYIHPSSVLYRCAPDAVVYDTAIATDKLYMHDVAAIQLAWLPELAPHFFEQRKQPARP
jgi:ATP-dependent RNA helicase DDX35